MTILNMPFSEWSPYLFILLAGALPTHIFRWLGVLLSQNLSEEGEMIKWVKAVATALVAGLSANLVFFPNGSLALVPLFVRLSALIIGFGVFLISGKRLLLGVLTTEIVLIGSIFLFTPLVQ